MKTQKILLYLACLIIVISAGINIYLYKRVVKLSGNAAPVVVAQDEFADAGEGIETADDNPDISYIRKLEYQLNAAEEELDMVSKRLAEELDKQKDNMGPQNNLLLNPAFKKSMMNSIDRDYALIYGPMYLSPDDLDKFKEIVAEWRIANSNRNAIRLAASTPEEREAVESLRQETREKYNSEFIELMGEEKFRIYDDFKNSGSERYTLERFMKTLPTEYGIDDTQAYNLIVAMYEERKSVENEMVFEDSNEVPANRNRNKYLHDLERNVDIYKRYEEVTGDILPPAQAEQLKTYLRQRRESYESMLNRMSQRMGSGRDVH